MDDKEFGMKTEEVPEEEMLEDIDIFGIDELETTISPTTGCGCIDF